MVKFFDHQAGPLSGNIGKPVLWPLVLNNEAYSSTVKLQTCLQIGAVQFRDKRTISICGH
jgi:hypothetical protein